MKIRFTTVTIAILASGLITACGGGTPTAASTAAPTKTAKYAYVVNNTDNTVSQYTIGATGTLTANGVAVATGVAPKSVAVDPTRKYAYVVNSTDNTVSQYTIGTTGTLALNGPAIPTGLQPNFCGDRSDWKICLCCK